MIVVIVAGGSGTRLWPISRPDYPKHLLKINGSSRSLVQATYDRAKLLADQVYVVSDHSHSEHVRKQLPDLSKDHFIIEPGRRGTANAIIAALAVLAKVADPDEAIAFVSADHYIRDTRGFVQSFRLAGRTSQAAKRIVLIGVEPDYPATGFGYIQKGDSLVENEYVYEVASFKEKPDFPTAKKYLTSGNYLWNCGYFVGSIGTFVDKMGQFAPALLASYEQLAKASKTDFNDRYLALTSDTIDYALIEKVDDLLVVPAAFDWMDLGSFNDLHKATGGDEQGNHVQGTVEIESVTNSLVHNHEEKPVAVVGLDNVAVINTEHGLLVTRKDLSQKIGEVSKRFDAKKS